MGQQQILLIILVSIIVGVAIVAGIKFFDKEVVAFEEAEYSELLIETAEQAQAWVKKPAMLGGGGGNFENLGFDNIGCPGETSMIPGNDRACMNESGSILIGINRSKSRVLFDITITHAEKKYQAILSAGKDDIMWAQPWKDMTNPPRPQRN